MQISLDKNDLEAIAAKVAERLQPLLKDNGKVEDAILDVDEVCQLLKTPGKAYIRWLITLSMVKQISRILNVAAYCNLAKSIF